MTAIRKIAAAAPPHRGYPALLNLEAQPHWTVFLSDFALSSADIRRLRRQLERCPTHPLFIDVGRGVRSVIREMRCAGADLRRDYLSLQGIISRHRNMALLDSLFERLPRRDLARIDIPFLTSGFRRSHATHSLRVVMDADYDFQDRVGERFFALLAKRRPYEVSVETTGGELRIRDSRGWFGLAGRLRNSERRTLPDGEVAYSAGEIAENVDGDFVVDGAILPIAQHPRFAAEARILLQLSREMKRHPLRLEICRGMVVGLKGSGRAPRLLTEFFEKNERYRHLNEVGISFNDASTRFIHSWPAASNEVRPGVHLGIGGAANPDDDDPRRAAMVHIDCIAANCKVFVNGRPFLRTSS